MPPSEGITSEIDIVDRFVRDGKFYATFKLKGHPHPFLYFTSLSEPLRALYCGPDLDVLVERTKANEGACIECVTCVNVPAGVSISGERRIEMDLTIDDARHILARLKDALRRVDGGDPLDYVVL